MIHTENGLPVNLDAERFVLGAIQLNGELFDAVNGALASEDFSIEKHRRIYRRMRDIHERGDHVSRITLATELQNHRELESCDGLSYLATLDDGLPQLPNIDSYVKLVKEKALLRRTIFACQQMIDRCMTASENAQEILIAAEATVTQLTQDATTKHGQWLRPGEVIEAYPGGLSAFLDPRHSGEGIPLPWPGITESLCGLHPGDLFIVAGRPSMGKSLVAMQIALHAAIKANEAAVFSLEMTGHSMVRRLISNVGRVDAQKFRSGYLSREERDRVAAAIGSISELGLWIDDTKANTIPAITSALRKLMAKRPIKLVMVDHLQLMRSTGRSESRHQELSAITHALKHIAKQFEVVVVLCSQLNRECEKDNRVPMLADLKETGSIEEDADVVLFVHRWERYEKFRGREDLRGQADFIIAKQREGPIGKHNMVFLDRLQKFETQAGCEAMTQGEA